jgi:RNA polymerase sigma-70 factor (ECF subfamily)
MQRTRSRRLVSDADVRDPAPEIEAVAALNSALSRLPDEQREVIELAVGANMTYQQIADHVGVPGIVVQRRINRGLQSLQVALRDVPYLNGLQHPESDRS